MDKKYWSQKVLGLDPYVAGEQPKTKFIKLNTNENPYPPSPKVLEAIGSAAKRLRLYPDANSGRLCEAIAESHGIPPDNVFCSNGSDEALAFCYMAFFDPGRPVKTVDVTYSFYPVWARLFDISLDRAPLKEDYTVDVEALMGAENVILANPNAPTGIALDADSLEAVISSARGVAVIDEAYVAYGGGSVAGLVGKYGNLAVVRTFSKSHSLAGLRAGYVIADSSLITALKAVKDSFNSYPLDMLAQAGAEAAIRDEEYSGGVIKKITDERARVVNILRERGFCVLDSSANFIFVRCGDAREAYAHLRQNGILVRHFDSGRTGSFLRVTIGTPVEMDAFLKAMEDVACG